MVTTASREDKMAAVHLEEASHPADRLGIGRVTCQLYWQTLNAPWIIRRDELGRHLHCSSD